MVRPWWRTNSPRGTHFTFFSIKENQTALESTFQRVCLRARAVSHPVAAISEPKAVWA